MQAGSTFGLRRIGQIAISVKDVERATAFYRDVLGMQYLFSAGSLAFFDCGGVRLMLSCPESAESDHPASTLYYAIDDIHKTYETLRERGVIFVDEPHLIAEMGTYDLWMAFFYDSEHNILAIMGEIPRA